MKKTFSSKKSAFSLIELSIVLIVIGLLIAGITGGASLIKSSELRSVMSEARGYAVAVNAFYSQYDALPGDYNRAVGSQSTYLGDNDGTIEFAGGSATTLGTSGSDVGSEGTVAWYALKQIGAIDDDLTYVAAGTAQTPGTNIPASKIKSAGWIFSYVNSSQNAVVLTRETDTGANGEEAPDVIAAALLPSDALSIDAKIDDGTPTTGKLRTVGTNTNCNSGASYTIGGTDITCSISYQIDVNS